MKLTVRTLKVANLSYDHFARLVGVHSATIDRYFAKTVVQKPESIRKIEAGAAVLHQSGLIWPDITYFPNGEKKKEYAKNKKLSDRFDKKFTTAYKKELKKQRLS